ncbi:Vacuolar protein sorting-associated protein 29 [Malassezia vespertilionis]|uniref:Vacuolar protein sorting-associated protein 29 n=1 Tax=Malassezia vespertilionis TaxID=2020962 RepID=UPI0024B084F0|nr:Vacuolar protein sorting-associated protein 29 [Malassezia vespertilionis]WFD05511.1 Vacuolar protein sorting-associated protein 29 [Malassezia vespertilionis]
MLVLVIGMLVLVTNLPDKFQQLLAPGKIEQVICTGNICDKPTFDFLRALSSELHVVRGDYDEVLPVGDKGALANLARSMGVDVLLSGATHKFEAYQYEGYFFVNPGSATGAWISESSAVCGAETWEKGPLHESGAKDTTEKPGCTAHNKTPEPRNGPPPLLNELSDGTIPSFALLDIQGPLVVVYVYQYIGGDVKVERLEYWKPMPQETTQEPAAPEPVTTLM